MGNPCDPPPKYGPNLPSYMNYPYQQNWLDYLKVDPYTNALIPNPIFRAGIDKVMIIG